MLRDHKAIFPEDQLVTTATPSGGSTAFAIGIGKSSDEEAEAAFQFLCALGSGLSLTVIDPDKGIRTRNIRLPDDAKNLRSTLKWVQSSGVNLYYALNEPAADLPHDKRPAKTEISLLRGIAVDVDPVANVEAEPGGFAKERDRLLRMTADALRHPTCPPTAVVDTGNGVQLLWLFSEPLSNTPDVRAQVEAQSAALASLP